MTIQKNLLAESKYPLKATHTMGPIGICVHNTANDASAKSEISYMVSNSLSTSFHIAVDDIEAWQGIPLNRNAWHAGDGANGEGNRKYIGIEICYSKSGGEKFDKAEDNAAEVIAQLLKDLNWGIERVKKHQDFSGKYCPHRTLDLGWDRFINKVKAKLGGSMADMYKMKSGHEVDLANRGSNVVLADKFDEVMYQGVYVKKTEKDEAVRKVEEDLGRERELTHTLTINAISICRILGLPDNATNDQVLAEIQRLKTLAPVPTDMPEENLTINGRPWTLNGINKIDGKIQANYKRAD